MQSSDSQQIGAAALEHLSAGRLHEAQSLLRELADREPFNAGAFHLLGIVSLQLGDAPSAIAHISRAIELNPENAAYYAPLAIAHKAMGQLDRALTAFRKLAALRPELPDSHYNVGVVLEERGLFDEAIEAYHRCLKLRPNFAEALNNLGHILQQRGAVPEARAVLERAVACRPEFPEALNNLGCALQEQGEVYAAEAGFRRAIEFRPGYAEALMNLGFARLACGEIGGDFREALDLINQAVKLSPQSASLHSALVGAMNYPDGISSQELFAAHKHFGRMHGGELPPEAAAAVVHDPRPDRPLRIGYVSPDMYEHAIVRFFLPLLQHADRQHYRPVVFNDALRTGKTTQFLREQIAPQDWHDVAARSNDELADLIRSESIDILVDLAGHSSRNRLPLFARKPAPIQVTYLAYPNTTGLDRSIMDYRLTDALADPAGLADEIHTEQLVRLPDTFLCYSPHADAPEVAPPPFQSSGQITFGSFNNPIKLTRRIARCWSEILAAVPGSRLLLKGRIFTDEWVRQNLVRFIADGRIDLARIAMVGWEPSQRSHHARYGEVDIGLDTFPYHGTTTTGDALWMGVPVISIEGDVHRARVGVSMLTNAGLGELIARDHEDYIRIAVALARDRRRLAEIRGNLRSQMRGSPLMNAERFMRNLESAYRQMWSKKVQ